VHGQRQEVQLALEAAADGVPLDSPSAS